MKEKLNVLITGASRGIGNAIAITVAHRAAKLLVTSHFPESLTVGINRIRETYDGPIVPYNIDQAKGEEAAIELATWIKQQVDKLDIVILCAGNYYEGDLIDIPSRNFEDTMTTNFSFYFYLVRNVIELVRRGNCPRIIIIGSTAAYDPYPVPTYGISKYALRGLAVNLRRELMVDNIGVTFVSPGGTLTDMWSDVDVPFGRLLDPTDLAKMIDCMFDLSPQAVVEEIIIRPMMGEYNE